VARIAGVNLPTNKRAVIALQYIHGIGQKTAKEIMAKLNLPMERRVSQLTDAQTNHIRNAISSEFKVEGALKSEVQMNIKRLMDIGTYRGKRHRKGFRFADKGRERMQEQEKVRGKLLRAKRKLSLRNKI